MTMKEQIDLVRAQLIAIIRNSVSFQKDCIGMYYKNLGEAYTIQQTEEEYDTTPIVAIIYNDKSFAFGSIEVATVYDIYIKGNQLICTMRSEFGEDLDHTIDNLAIESLHNIVNWLYEHHFAKPAYEISDTMYDTLLEDEDLCESIFHVMREENESDDTSNGRQMAQMIRAYRNNDCSGVFMGYCGWDLPTLIAKSTGADENNLVTGGSLFSKIEKQIRPSYPLWSSHDYEEIKEIIGNEFSRIKQIVCEEYNFNDEQYKTIYKDESPFDKEYDRFSQYILHNIDTSHTNGNEMWDKFINSLTLLATMSSVAAMYREVAAYYGYKELMEYFDSYDLCCDSDHEWETEERKAEMIAKSAELMKLLSELNYLEHFLIQEEIADL